MVEYVWNRRVGSYQPEQRRELKDPPTGTERRKSESIRTTSDQFDFLRSSLMEREEKATDLAKQSRRIRHSIVFLALVYGGILLSWNGTLEKEVLSLESIGIALTIGELSMLFPLAISYLVLLACRVTALRLRKKHECWLIEAQLERFGCATAYGILRVFRDDCENPKADVDEEAERLRHHKARVRHYMAETYMHDVWFGIFACALLGVTGYLSVKNLLVHEMRGIGAWLYLTTALVGIVFAGIALWCLIASRRTKQTFVHSHIMRLLGRKDPLLPYLVNGNSDAEQPRQPS